MRREQRFGRRIWGRLLVGVLVAGGAAERAEAKSDYLAAFRNEYPAAVGSRIDACSLCHSAVPQLNSYGSAFGGAGREFASIEALDSDGDGVLNLAEIGALTFPGDPADVPALPSPTPTATLPLATPTPTPSPTELAIASPTATPTGTSGICVGSCNGDDSVAINELVTLVNIALGALSPSACAQGVPGGATVDIALLIRAVGNALGGCASA